MQDQFPIVWKVVLRLQKDISTHTTVTYTTKFAFSTPQLENGNIVTPETWREVSPGQSVTLETGNRLSRAIKGMNDLIILKNRSGRSTTVGAGILIGDPSAQRYEPTMRWNAHKGPFLIVKVEKLSVRRAER
ncbi:hypothetical protein FRC03_000701 [Tulasnella sp. 419]|nr:hypothetical protein FRC03_000701 [Tulasnella sp. 419]